jgi:hypothetical protein
MKKCEWCGKEYPDDVSVCEADAHDLVVVGAATPPPLAEAANSSGRPVSVTVIAWILLVTGGLSLVTSFFTMDNPQVRELMAKSPLPIPLQYVLMYLGLTISLVSGFAMLRGCDWGRKLYVGWSCVGFLIGFATSPMKFALMPGLVFFIVIVFFLFRPRANAYFTGHGA